MIYRIHTQYADFLVKTSFNGSLLLKLGYGNDNVKLIEYEHQLVDDAQLLSEYLNLKG